MGKLEYAPGLTQEDNSMPCYPAASSQQDVFQERRRTWFADDPIVCHR